MMEGQARADLRHDIAANGLLEPIVLFEDKVLDGRNRYREGSAVGALLRFEQYQGDDPAAYVFSRNIARRHLTEGQRALAAAKLSTMRRGSNQHSPIGATSQARAAELLNVSKRSVERAAVVRDRAVPGLVTAVERGHISVSTAADIAREPAVRQQAILAELCDADGLPTPEGMKALAPIMRRVQAAKVAQKKTRRTEREAELGAKQQALPDKRYGVIYADPEWQFETFDPDTGAERSASNHYPTSPLEVIKARDIPSISAADAVLFLCATVPMLPQALEVMVAWGFTYKSSAVWVKDRAGTGYWFRNRHELLLVGTRGNIPAPAMGTQRDSVIEAPTGRHSEKPAAFYELIESYYPTLPKIELNARTARLGWDRWGNEAPAGDDGAQQ
jgi:N6-adenosine-specific RNA methylase IME4